MDLRNITNPGSFRHRTDVQLRFNDIDILGHVNNTVYLSFYDLGKALYFRAVRKDYNFQQVETIIANVNCAYMEPILFGDEIEVLTRCEAIGEKSFRLLQCLRDKRTGHLKSACETVMVSYDPKLKASAPLPDAWRQAIAAYEGRPF